MPQLRVKDCLFGTIDRSFESQGGGNGNIITERWSIGHEFADDVQTSTGRFTLWLVIQILSFGL